MEFLKLKKQIAPLLMLLVPLTAGAVDSADVNGDNQINIKDVAAMINLISTNSSTVVDLSGDGQTTLIDVVKLIDFVLSDAQVNNGLQKRNLSEASPVPPRFVRPLDKVWPAQANEIDIALWKDDKFAAVSISIDDNIKPDHSWWTGISNQYGWKFTWYVIEDRIGTSNGGEWSDFQTLFNQGHDIESHTLTHSKDADGTPDYDNTRPESEIIVEYRDSLIAMNQNITGNDAETIAYPYGRFQRNPAADYAIAARGTIGSPNKPERTDYLNISSLSDNGLKDIYLDSILLGTGSAPTAWLGNNSYKRGWAGVFFHTVQNRTETAADLANLSARSSDLWIGLLKDVAKYGQERDTANITVTTNTSTQLAFNLSDDMDDSLFDYPLTLKVRLHNAWNTVNATQAGAAIGATIVTHGGAKFALIQAVPDKGIVVVTP